MATPSNSSPAGADSAPAPSDFIRDIVTADVAAGKYKKIVTRFPPEPNGYLHIGHAKSICLNFGIAREFAGQCNLRMDDTNPTKEEVEYVESIQQDVRWLIEGWADDRLGLKPKGKTPDAITVDGKPDFYLGPADPSAIRNPQSALVEPFYASDYFDQLYEYALQLIKKGKAYVCDHTPEEVDKMRGAPDKQGQESRYRDRAVEENLDLFVRMKNGEFPDGTRTLRAKIDMFSPNVWMRDPVLYRIRHAEHHH
ncbi:MAG: glutamine--tRNA ligase, partial [Verrucomicrobia bacterium]|nr:glutamine--tRNA ligase [Verrucomicrobiota bacterium]